MDIDMDIDIDMYLDMYLGQLFNFNKPLLPSSKP